MAKFNTIPEDCKLPQLREILDLHKLALTLQQHMWTPTGPGDMQVKECQINRIYYKPRGVCRIMFTAFISNGRSGEIWKQFYVGKLFHRKDAQEVFNSINRNGLTEPNFGVPVMFISKWKMIVWAFPNDPILPGLSLMATDERVLELAKASPENFGLTEPPTAITSELKKYVPRKRCSYIYTLQRSHANSHESSHTVFGKAYRQIQGKKAYEILRQLWQSQANQQGKLVLPEPYSYDQHNKILWQQALSGRSLAKDAGTFKQLPELASEIGQRLAALHDTDLVLARKVSIESQVEELKKSCDRIKQNFPGYSKTCNTLEEKLLTAAERLGPGAMATIHGSFKLSHIFSTEKGIAFIDFDGACAGDPGYDLGRFIAHIYRIKASGKISTELTEATIHNFCESYNDSVRAVLPQARIDWFVASHLVSSEIYKTVKRVQPSLVNQLLKIALHICR